MPVTLFDSTHGQMTHFELVVRIEDADGAHGVATRTPCTNGRAIHATIEHDLAPRLIGQRADLIEALWEKMVDRALWRSRWSSNYVDLRIDIALWDSRRVASVCHYGIAGWSRCACSLLRGWNRSDFPLDAAGTDRR
jgi:L-alanine-DL-glutamate epimerase-like enolase superfamily enzyme